MRILKTLSLPMVVSLVALAASPLNARAAVDDEASAIACAGKDLNTRNIYVMADGSCHASRPARDKKPMLIIGGYSETDLASRKPDYWHFTVQVDYDNGGSSWATEVQNLVSNPGSTLLENKYFKLEVEVQKVAASNPEKQILLRSTLEHSQLRKRLFQKRK